MIGRFQGETAWDAIVNDNGLDIEAEEEFRQWLRNNGFNIGQEYHINPDITLADLTAAYALWAHEREQSRVRGGAAKK